MCKSAAATLSSQPAFAVRVMKVFWNRWVYPYRSFPFFLWFLNICMPLWCHDYFFRIRYYRVSAIGILFAPLLGVHFSFGKINTAQSNKRTHLINNYTFYALIFLCGWIGVAVYVAIKELASALFVLNDFYAYFSSQTQVNFMWCSYFLLMIIALPSKNSQQTDGISNDSF